MLKKKIISSYSLPARKAIRLVSFSPQTSPIGSFSYKLAFPGDIDVRETIVECCTKKEALQKIAKDIQNMVLNILKSPSIYFSEFKAGLDYRFPDDRNKYIIRWNSNDVLAGLKVLDGGVVKTLVDALDDPTVVKLDIWAPIEGRYVEVSNFMILQMVDKDGNVSFLNGTQPDYVSSIINDIRQFFSPSHLNAFKATKRMMLLANHYKDEEMLKKIVPLIESDAGLLYQIISDLDTISEMVVKLGYKAPYEFFWKELDEIKSRLSIINQFDIDDEKINQIIDLIVENKLIGNDLVDRIDPIIKELLDILNEVVMNYDKENGIYPPPENYF
jgi:hypothetical protein